MLFNDNKIYIFYKTVKFNKQYNKLAQGEDLEHFPSSRLEQRSTLGAEYRSHQC